MGGASSYIAILSIFAFLSIAWTATKVSKYMGVSSIVLEIAVGVIFGPSVLGLIPESYAECEHSTHTKCDGPHGVEVSLKELIAQERPIGADLGRIAAMTHDGALVCDPAAYGHHDGHGHDPLGVDGHGEESHSDDNHEGGAHTGGEHGTGADGEHLSGGAAEDEDGSHGWERSHGNDDVSSHGNGHQRRLSGGGSYHSYDECLMQECESDISHHCQLTPDVFTLVGHAGVAMMIFESGMHFDFEKAAVVGPKACIVAVIGTIFPLITGTLLTMAYGYPLLPDGISVGTSLAPTSVGIALRLLGEAGVLQEDFGQAIITAAFVDDILSLVLFNVLFSLRGDFDVVPVVVYPIIGVVLMGLAMAAAVKFWPVFLNDKLIPWIAERLDGEELKVPRSDEALFLVMMAVLIVYALITHFLGTHLWGCFLAGMSFACLNPPHHAHHVWVRQTKRYTGWMIRIFFSCTVAFSIPVGKLLSFEAFWKGSLMGIGPCIMSKVFCAPFMGDQRWVIGWAMVGRAEFAYLIAQMAAAAGMIDEDTFSIAIWALLYATIFAPFLFRIVLTRYVRAHDFGSEASEDAISYDDVEIDMHGSKEHKMEFSETKVTDAPIVYGSPSDLEDSMPPLPQKERDQYSQERVPEKVETHATIDGRGAPPKTTQVLRGPWFGRPPNSVNDTRKQGNGGFLCCLFFKKIMI